MPDIRYGLPMHTETEETVVMPAAVWEAHVKRVESLCELLESLFGALAQNPMFGAMVPPDLLAKLRK